MSKKSRIQSRLGAVLRLRMDEGLKAVDQRLGIDNTDYEQIDSEETRRRILMRMHEQDHIIFPQRMREGQITPEWRDYSARRRL